MTDAAEARRLQHEAWHAAMREKNAPPLYEVLDELFDFGDQTLWDETLWRNLRPRLVIFVAAALTKLEAEVQNPIGLPIIETKRRLLRAREIMRQLAPKAGIEAAE